MIYIAKAKWEHFYLCMCIDLESRSVRLAGMLRLPTSGFIWSGFSADLARMRIIGNKIGSWLSSYILQLSILFGVAFIILLVVEGKINYRFCPRFLFFYKLFFLEII